MGTPYTPLVSAGSPQASDFSSTDSEQRIESILQEMAKLSGQPGPSPKQCLWCWLLFHGHAHHSIHGDAHSLSAAQQQHLHNKHHQEHSLTTEQPWTTPGDPQQHDEHQQQHVILNEQQQQLVHSQHEQCILHESKEQLVHNQHEQQHVLHESNERVVHNQQQQQQVLQERKEQQFYNQQQQQHGLHESKEQLVFNQQQQQHASLHKSKEQLVHNQQQQVVLNQHEQQHVLHESKEQLVLNQHEQQHVLHESNEQLVHNQHEQQHVLHESNERVVHNQQQQQQVLQERKEQQFYNQEQQQHGLHESKEQLVFNQQQQQHGLHESKEQLVHNQQQQVVLNQHEQQHVLHESKEQLVHNQREQQHVLHESKEQLVHNQREQQHVLHESNEQLVYNQQQQQHVLHKSKEQLVHNQHEQQHVLHESNERQQVNHGGSGLENSLTATTCHVVYDQGSSRNSRPLGGGNSALASSPISQSPKREREQSSGILATTWLSNITGRGPSHGVVKVEHDSGKWEMEKVELMKNVSDMDRTTVRDSRQALKGATDAESQLIEQLQESNSVVKILNSKVSSMTSTITQYKSKTTEYETRIADYKAHADDLTKQLLRLELTIATFGGGAGAHKDSHATPPNLVKCREVVKQAVATFTKAFTAFLKERNAFESHVAVLSVPDRKYAVQAYICSRLFAGFENDCYMDGLDCIRSSKYLPAKYEETQIFLRNQDPDLRYKQYVAEFESADALGVQGIMDTLKNLDTFKKLEKDANAPFFQFCCRKLVSIMNDVDKFAKEFPPSRDYSQHFLLHQLATNAAYCVKFLKPFVTLALAAFQLHRLAFQFHPPARIFRYASGTPFDATYMEHAVPIDNEDSDKKFIVGAMLVPGFQVGTCIIQCIVSSVVTVTTRGPL